MTSDESTEVRSAGDLGETTLRPGSGLPSAARAAVSGWLKGRVPPRVTADAELLVSELVTNSFRHACGGSGPVRVRARSEPGSVWVEVADAGRHGAVVKQRVPASGTVGGFGLNLVDALATQWGVSYVDGTQVWFRLALEA